MFHTFFFIPLVVSSFLEFPLKRYLASGNLLYLWDSFAENLRGIFLVGIDFITMVLWGYNAILMKKTFYMY